MDGQDEAEWLRHAITRLRTALRFSSNPRAESILRELITEAERRLAVLADRPEPPKEM
jgi:hypothetical protein